MRMRRKAHIAAKEATHLRKEVPKPSPPSLVASAMRFLAAIFKSFMSEFIMSWLS